ncbi:hypothetical protein H9Y13_18745 [Aeromonas veronii]|uniref:hypothetical protein n=1 Tax=Aeromonas TaxID=642 RepID=UPI0022EA1C86|nr:MULTISPECIES: hypothetical protein [Aeromonas]KAJ8740050.1 hypothetical protein H9Y13_18745 [Aeromonas veronii]MDA3317868.1 hypothetical protein [Aeromonas sp. PI_26]
MRFFLEDQNMVLWADDDGCCGIVTKEDSSWSEYQEYLNAGHLPEPYPVQTIDADTAMAMVEREFERACTPLRGTSTQAEIDSWPQQAAEARAYLADDRANTPLIDGIALPWEDKEALCRDVIAKNDRYAAAMGDILMWRRIAIAAVEAMFERGPRSGFSVQYPDVPSAT